MAGAPHSERPSGIAARLRRPHRPPRVPWRREERRAFSPFPPEGVPTLPSPSGPPASAEVTRRHHKHKKIKKIKNNIFPKSDRQRETDHTRFVRLSVKKTTLLFTQQRRFCFTTHTYVPDTCSQASSPARLWPNSTPS